MTTVKLKGMVAFNILILVPSLVLFARSDGQVCSPGQTNYSSTEDKEVTEEVTTTTRETITKYYTCWRWFRFKTCQKETLVERTVTRNRTTVKSFPVEHCCPGYVNISNSCEEGCPEGKYGVNCTENCSCPSYCEKESGDCICDPGFHGENCSEGCANGTYGINCQQTCRCKNNSTCNSTDGSCTCTSPGWQGDLCDGECTNSTYGLFCKESCTCNDNQTCDPVYGTCTCKVGWKGENCSEECDDMKYGINCLKKCTCNRDHTKTCDKITGLCTCHPGYNEENCSKECPFGMYGPGCTSNCSDTCTHTQYCYPENGTCICLGTKGTNCTEDCEPGTYGPDCGWKCDCSNGTSENESCNNITGQCYCRPGRTGLTCDQVCQYGLFDKNCSKNCTVKCTGTDYCDPFNGTCICIHKRGDDCSEDCKNGYYGYNCLSKCNCSFSKSNGSCDQNGGCLCQDGWAGPRCEEECLFGLFGENCSKNCTEKCKGTNYCDPVNGTCFCIHKRGENCSEDCENGSYGYNCQFKCNCSYSTSNGSCDQEGGCFCQDGWEGAHCNKEISRNATNTQKAKQTTTNFVQENLVYIIPVICLLIAAVLILTVMYRRKVFIRKKVQKGQDSLSDTGKDNPCYDEHGGAEEIPLKKSYSQSNKQLHEEAVLESENQSDFPKNHVTHTDKEPRDIDDKDDAVNYDHPYSKSNQMAECTEDSYAIPDKNPDLNVKSNGKKSRDEIQNEEVYDTTEESIVKTENILNEYNTFEDVKKMHKKAANREKEMEEDYDVISRSASQKQTIKDLEHYSNFEQVRKLSVQDSLEEDDMYNVLHEDRSQHRSAPMVHSSYHHISLKSKTVDGEVFSNVPSDDASTDSRKNQERKLSEKSNLLHDSIVEESDNEDSDETSKRRQHGAHSKEVDITEVIYDECDLDEDNEETKLGDDVFDTKLAVKQEIDIADVVYEECDDFGNEEPRPPSGALYENVEDETKNDKQEKVMIHSKDKRDDSHLKKRSERRKEDYENFVL